MNPLLTSSFVEKRISVYSFQRGLFLMEFKIWQQVEKDMSEEELTAQLVRALTQDMYRAKRYEIELWPLPAPFYYYFYISMNNFTLYFYMYILYIKIM